MKNISQVTFLIKYHYGIVHVFNIKNRLGWPTEMLFNGIGENAKAHLIAELFPRSIVLSYYPTRA